MRVVPRPRNKIPSNVWSGWQNGIPRYGRLKICVTKSAEVSLLTFGCYEVVDYSSLAMLIICGEESFWWKAVEPGSVFLCSRSWHEHKEIRNRPNSRGMPLRRS